jgi:putative tricarboxylic transport membrane protein
MLFQRLFMVVWLIVGLVMMYLALDYQAPFSYEPVGPRAYPLLMLGLMCLGLVYLIIRPAQISHTQEDDHPLDGPTLRKVVTCCAILLGFALLFEPLGFPLSSFIAALLFAHLYGGTWKAGTLFSLLLSIGLYLLFDRVLEVPLPLGPLAGLEG